MNNYIHDPQYMQDRCARDIPRVPSNMKNSLITRGIKWQGYNAMPIPYDKDVANLLNKEACKAFNSADPLQYSVSEQVTTLVGNECKRWICAIEAYITSHKPLIPLRVLLEGIFDINFATRLAKTRRWAWTRSYGMSPSEDDGLDQYDRVFTLDDRLDDLGQIFNYRYWFFWEEPEPEDWRYSLLDVEEPSSELKEKFKVAVRFVTPDTVPAVEEETVLSQVSSSGAIGPDGKRSKVWRIKEIQALNTFSSEPLVGHLTTVRKCAGEIREAITLTVPQSNSVKLIEKQVARICEDTLYSAYGLSPPEFEKELNRLYKENSSFLCRDLTKEGITKPRWILHCILEVFKEKYPNCPAWKYGGIYSDMCYILKDGTRVQTKRGHGLGMANALTTIMQCAAFQLFLWDAEHELITTPDALFYNDDGVIGSTSELATLAYEQAEEDLLSGLGLLKKNEKTYMGPVGVLCEKYSSPYLDRKESSWRYVRRIPFASPVIWVAKESWYLSSSPWNGREEGLIDRLHQFWGYESSPQEFDLPWWAGGWQKPTIYGVDTSFFDVVEPDQLMARGWNVGPPRLKPLSLKESKEIYKSPISYLYERYDLPDPVNRAFGIGQSKRVIAAQYSRGGSRSDVESWLRSESIRRHNAWNTPAKERSLQEYFELLVDQNPWKDILPPEHLCRVVQLGSITIYKEGGPCPVKQTNPYLGAVSWFTNKYIKHVIPWPEWPGRDIHFKPLTPEQMDYREETYLTKQNKYFVNEFESPGDVVIVKRFWNNDYAVAAACKTLTDSDITIEPFHLSLGGKYNQEEEANLRTLEFWSSPNLFYIWQIWGRTIPILYLNGKLTDDDVADIVSPISIEEPLSPAPPEQDRPPDFWEWYGSGMRQFEPFSLYHMYNEAGSTLVMSDTYKLFWTELGLRGDKLSMAPPAVSPIMSEFFETHLGFRKEKCGDAYIYRPPDRPDPLDDMSDEGEGLGFMWS